MVCKVPNKKEKKNPTEKESFSGCHNHFLIHAHRCQSQSRNSWVA